MKVLITLILIGIFPCWVLSQNLQSEVDKFLKEKVMEKQNAETKDANIQTNKNILPELKGNTNNTNIKAVPSSSILDTIPAKNVAKDTVTMKTAVDSLNNQNSRMIMMALDVDTNAIDQSKWEAKKHKSEGNLTEEDYQKKNILSDVSYKKYHILDSGYKVFGWHPYWMGNAYRSYNFSLLTHVAYFAYDLNPETGGYQSIHNWRETAIVDSAHKYDCKALLTVINFGAKNNATFLSNNNKQQKVLIDNLITLLREKNADGVCLDFENVSVMFKNQLTNCIIDISRSLKSANSKYIVTLAVPAKDFYNVFDLTSLKPHVDLFVIMGYVFYGEFSKVAGPIAPLTKGLIWWELTIEKSIAEYKASGIDPKKIIMALPYYGAEWHTRDLIFPSLAYKFSDYFTLREIRARFANIVPKLDEHSKSNYQVYRNTDGKYYQLWYEDTSSMRIKYDFIKQQGLGGIGIWALGYDNGLPDMWQLIARKFAIPANKMDSVMEAKEAKKEGSGFKKFVKMLKKALKDPMSILKSPGPLIKLLGGLLGVGVVGLLLVMKMAKKMKKTMLVGAKGGLIGIAIAIIAVVILTLKFVSKNELIFLFIGFLIGAVILFILTYRFIIRDKDLP